MALMRKIVDFVDWLGFKWTAKEGLKVLSCTDCRYFDKINFCSFHKFTVSSEDVFGLEACSYFKKRHAKLPDVHVKEETETPLDEEAEIPFAEDEGDIYVDVDENVSDS